MFNCIKGIANVTECIVELYTAVSMRELKKKLKRMLGEAQPAGACFLFFCTFTMIFFRE